MSGTHSGQVSIHLQRQCPTKRAVVQQSLLVVFVAGDLPPRTSTDVTACCRSNSRHLVWRHHLRLYIRIRHDCPRGRPTCMYTVIMTRLTRQAALTPVDRKQLPSLVLTTSSGAVQLVSNDGLVWIREESLADVVAVRFIDLGEPEVEEIREVLAVESFFGRAVRHVLEIKVSRDGVQVDNSDSTFVRLSLRQKVHYRIVLQNHRRGTSVPFTTTSRSVWIPKATCRRDIGRKAVCDRFGKW